MSPFALLHLNFSDNASLLKTYPAYRNFLDRVYQPQLSIDPHVLNISYP